MDDDLRRAARAASVRGSLLFHLFLAEALAGEAMAQQATAVAPAGWALDIGPDGYEAVALDAGDPPGAIARVSFASDGRPMVEALGGRPAGDRETALARARAAGLAFAAHLSGRHAVLIVPPVRDGRRPGDLEGYAVRLAERAEDLAVGPHLRFVAREHTLEPLRPAIGLDLVLPGGARDRRAHLVHADAPAPSELHVFLSLNHGVGLEVATPRSGALWRVEGERIERLA